MGSILCEHCTAACCRYVALPLDKPARARDYDDIRWYLMHANISIFVEDGDWYVQFFTTCKNLGEENMCTIYETRPEMCREYEAGSCDYTGGGYDYDHLFTHPKQIEEFYRERTGKTLDPCKPSGPRRPTKRRKAKTAACHVRS